MLYTILAHLQGKSLKTKTIGQPSEPQWTQEGRDVPASARAQQRNSLKQMEKISETWVRKTITFKFVEGVRRSIKFRSVLKPLTSTRNVVQAGNVVVLDEKNPHIRNNRDGTVIKLNMNSGVYTMDVWVCLNETGLVFSWQGQ